MTGGRTRRARAVGLGVVGVYLLGALAAAAGVRYEGDGYGALGMVAAGLFGTASAWPLWLLLRRPPAPFAGRDAPSV